MISPMKIDMFIGEKARWLKLYMKVATDFSYEKS
jgi:hypothetical protein